MRALPYRRLAFGVLLAVAAVAWFLALLGTGRVTSVKLLVVGFGTNQIGTFAVIRVTNAGPHSIAYWGYQTDQPWYCYEFDTPAGPTNYCPFLDHKGSQKYVLAARESAEFKAQTMAHGPYRITLQYVPTSLMDRLDGVDWSIPPRWVAWVANRLPRPGHRPVSTPPLNERPANES
jgi:hypothetical protein